jgi:hypothetical protein
MLKLKMIKMERQIKKLYNNLAEIRDYDVQDAINKHENIIVKYDGDIMTLSPNDLKEKLVSVSRLFKSKVGGKDYKLNAYEWNPDQIDY